jgi:hypothetical protein
MSVIPGINDLPIPVRKGQGTEAKIKIKAIRKNQNAFLWADGLMALFTAPLPIVISIMAINIPVGCSITQNRAIPFFMISPNGASWINFKPSSPVNH